MALYPYTTSISYKLNDVGQQETPVSPHVQEVLCLVNVWIPRLMVALPTLTSHRGPLLPGLPSTWTVGALTPRGSAHTRWSHS